MLSPNIAGNKTLTIRIGNGTLAFMTKDTNGTTEYHQHPVKSGMSMAANLRTAFREETYLAECGHKAVLIVSSPVLLIPEEELTITEDTDIDALYGDTITGHKGEVKIARKIPEFNVYAVFPVNSDLQMVVNDHFHSVEIQNVMTYMWKHLYGNYFRGSGQRRLFAYFHDKKVDICCFDQHRIRFANNFDATNAQDALYYILYVWKQLGMNQDEDELYIVGDTPDKEWMASKTSSYVKKVININKKDDSDKNKPYDLTVCE